MNKHLIRVLFLLPLSYIVINFGAALSSFIISYLLYTRIERELRLRNSSIFFATIIMVLKGILFTSTFMVGFVFNLFPVEQGGQIFINYMAMLTIIETMTLNLIILFPDYILKLPLLARLNLYFSSIKIPLLMPILFGAISLIGSMFIVFLTLAIPKSTIFLLIFLYVVLLVLYNFMVGKNDTNPPIKVNTNDKIKRIGLKLLKWISIIALLLVVISIGSYHFFIKEEINNQRSVDLNDQNYIKQEILAKDSENRGYSDQALKYMNEDLEVFNNDDKMRKWYTRMLIYNRLILLSDTKESYVKNFIEYSKSSNCLVTYTIRNDNLKDLDFKHYLTGGTLWETDKEPSFMKYLDRKYEQQMTYDETYSMLNQHPTEEECNDYLKLP